ncbi:uncharacterized protein LOC116172911 [Photinus pyralis]|uniref:Uncharacterized protein n=1 Tax=Photinus pyralis TaxID=7054 RepID=A0A1Y1MW20_PHOPY|nr:uncharacterized protein LOC116172911 [Photinus pyralis]XP_031346048.1 uncharacterized protein LOC116172911 [Photinus pyralis]XP_031346049.1 uncharacterized protein LOC116172911 [Photinus pyralis]
MFHELAYLSNHHFNREWADSPDNKITHSKSASGGFDRVNTRAPFKVNRQNSSVVGQKLRDSKWFLHNEINILCAVLESGFVLQKKNEVTEDHRAIALWEPGHERSKSPENITIYTVILHKQNYKFHKCDLLSFWEPGSSLKINNQSDQLHAPNSEEVIRNQVAYAERHKQKWENSEHFTYWCRYGEPSKPSRTRLFSDNLKWGNLGLNAGLFLLKRRRTVSSSN